MDGPKDPPDFRELMATAQRIQSEVARIRDGLVSKTATGESGGGVVRCTVSGIGEVLELAIDPTFPAFADIQAAENRHMLEQLVGLGDVVRLPRGEAEARQIAQPLHQCVDLGA